jgi:hypothetical protein
MASVKFNVWCGTGNYVHVVGGSSLKMEVSDVFVHVTVSREKGMQRMCVKELHFLGFIFGHPALASEDTFSTNH